MAIIKIKVSDEEADNLVLIRKFLKKINVQRMNETKVSNRGRSIVHALNK